MKCSELGCSGVVIARGYCRRCYTALRRSGKLEAINPYGQTPEESFFAKVDARGVCWEWTATRCEKGYGRFVEWDSATKTRRRVLAHRWAYEFLVGEIPEGLTLDHLCRNKACVMPDHLEPVTQAENHRRYRKLIGAV